MGQLPTEGNIVFTGGHAATAAAATISYLTKKYPSKYNIYWIGAHSAVEVKKVAGIEEQILPGLGVEMLKIHAGRIQRKFSKHTILSFLRVPIGILESLVLLFRIRPRIVVSFGGYVGFAVSFAAWMLGIKVILHEQTMAVGLANKVSSKFATKIAIARRESAAFFPESKIILTGNPIMPQITKVKPKSKIGNPATIFITGGSRGSMIVNNTVEYCLAELLKKYRVIHQTGQLDFDHFLNFKSQLSEKIKDKYEVYPVINPLDIASFYEKCDLYIGRAGANTVAELLITQRPSILIPIPWSRFDEQSKNAQVAKESGIAMIIKQEELRKETLLEAIKLSMNNWNQIVSKMTPPKNILDQQASKNLVELIVQFLT